MRGPENDSIPREGARGVNRAEARKDAENPSEESLQECDWLENLSEDPYFRGLQDKVPPALPHIDLDIRQDTNAYLEPGNRFTAVHTLCRSMYDLKQRQHTAHVASTTRPQVTAMYTLYSPCHFPRSLLDSSPSGKARLEPLPPPLRQLPFFLPQTFLSLASSHNAVYRMVDGLRPLLEEFQVNTGGAHTHTRRCIRLKKNSYQCRSICVALLDLAVFYSKSYKQLFSIVLLEP